MSLNTLREGLRDAGFDFGVAAFFSWVGVTMYLSLDAIQATLVTIAQSAPGTRVVLTYNQPPRSLDEFSMQVTKTFASIAAGMGEPFVSFFRPEEIEQLLRSNGFEDIVPLGVAEARTTYFEGRADIGIAGAQRLVEGTVKPAA